MHEHYLTSSFPMKVYSFFILILSIACYFKEFSLIPILGLSSCSYLITALGLMNWICFGLWLIAGLFIYLLYSFKNSKLAQMS